MCVRACVRACVHAPALDPWVFIGTLDVTSPALHSSFYFVFTLAPIELHTSSLGAVHFRISAEQGAAALAAHTNAHAQMSHLVQLMA